MFHIAAVFAEGDERERGVEGAPTALASLCIDGGHRHHQVRWALLAASVENHFSGAAGSTFHLFPLLPDWERWANLFASIN